MTLNNIHKFDNLKTLLNNFECFTLHNLPYTTNKEDRIKTKIESYNQIKGKLNFEILDNELYYNDEYYNRLYFDIDEIDDNTTLYDIFESIQKLMFYIIPNIEVYISISGYVRDNEDNVKSFINKESLKDNWIYIIQQKDKQDEQTLIKEHIKKYSFHVIILNVLFKTDDLFKIFNYISKTSNETFKKQFNIKIDKAVYKLNKESQQLLRLSLSNKSNDKLIKNDTSINVECLERKYSINTILFFTSVGIIKKNDNTNVLSDYELNNDLLTSLTTPITTLTQHNKQTQQPMLKTKHNDNNISIFQFVKYQDKIININELYQLQNHYDFSTDVLPFCHSVLTPEETIEEILNLDLPEELHKNKTPDEWRDEIVKTLKSKIIRDITNIRTLYNLKGNVKKYYEQEQEKIKNDKQENAKELIKQLYKTLKPYLNKLDYYIDKYSKLNFVSHSFYDVFESKEDKKDKLIYNCYKLLDGEIINAYNNKQFKNITQFRNNFKLNSNKANEIFELLTPFENVREFNRLRTEYIIKTLSEQQINIYKQNILKFLDILETSFVDKNDFTFYLSFYCHKLQSNKTINKSIINQGTETDPAINSFKTFFNELINNYTNIKSANVNNVNKTLNGTYFTGNLLIIEELPKKIKDIDNLINILREYSSKRFITVEEKGDKPKDILNGCDFIINTNHTVKSMFKDYNDAKGLLKRFRIITRKSIDINNEVNNLIDELNGDNNHIYQYLLKEYLIKDNDKDLFNYFNQHKNDYNDVMTLYLNSSSLSSTMNKKTTTTTIEDFRNEFKNDYLDNQYRFKLSKFRNYLIEQKVISLEHSKTLKQNIVILLNESNKNLVELTSDEDLVKSSNDNKNNKDLVKLSNNNKIIKFNGKDEKILNQSIDIIYNTYFEYDDNEY